MTFCNDAMLQILGYEPDELPNLTNQAYMTPDYAKRVESVFRQVYETGQPATSLDWELIGKEAPTGTPRDFGASSETSPKGCR